MLSSVRSWLGCFLDECEVAACEGLEVLPPEGAYELIDGNVFGRYGGGDGWRYRAFEVGSYGMSALDRWKVYLFRVGGACERLVWKECDGDVCFLDAEAGSFNSMARDSCRWYDLEIVGV
jgi:hypothetical protein